MFRNRSDFKSYVSGKVKYFRKYIGKRAGKGYNVRESVIDKIQTFFSVLSGHK